MGEVMSYKVSSENENFAITDQCGHSLLIYEGFTVVHKVVFTDEGKWGTARPFEDYPHEAQRVSGAGIIVEVGAGLGGFIPALVPSHRGRLVVIDPLNYVVAQEMLTFARRLPLRDWQRSHVDELIGRCHVYRDQSCVQLVNVPLGEALERMPSLAGSADVVIDYFGPMNYSHATGSEDTVEDLERSLLKAGGVLITKRFEGFPQIIRVDDEL